MSVLEVHAKSKHFLVKKVTRPNFSAQTGKKTPKRGKHFLVKKVRTPISVTRVSVTGFAHTFCVVYKRNSPYTYVWAKQIMPTYLFFPSRSLSHACVWVKLITPTRPYVRPHTLLVPHATRDGHRAPVVAMVQTLVHVRLTAVAMSLNYGCHVGQLQLPWLLNCNCHVWSGLM